MKQPLVSLISPCFNAEKYVNRLLESVLKQDYEAIEFIVIDDGSTDSTLDILKSYKEKFKKKNIKYRIVTKPNGGVASAINEGLAVFTGDYLTFIDADDFLNEASIRKRVAFLEKHPDYDAVYSATNVVHESNYEKVIEVKEKSGTTSRENLFLSMLKREGYIWTHAYLIRTSHFLKVNPLRRIEEFSVGQNIQLFLPLWYNGAVGYIDSPTVTIVQHDDSHSRRQRSETEKRDRENEIERTYLDTLNRIEMTDAERLKYKELIRKKHQMNTTRVFEKISSNKDELGRLYEYDEQKFRSGYLTNLETANQAQIAGKLVFSAHSIEKSLSNDKFEIGHGIRKSRIIIDALKVYKRKGFDQNHLAYVSTISVLKEFYERHQNTEFASDIKDIFGELFQEIIECPSTIGGATTVPLSQKKDNNKKNFRELSESRRAVRSYANKKVDRSVIKDAVQIATRTPTVCNRQAIHVYEMYDKDVIEAVLKVQEGIAFYDTPPVLLLITADDNGYMGANERNQGFVDGGLFVMSLLYALEYKGLAACPLHAMLNEVKEKTIRGMLDLPDSEKLITFVSAGHFKETNYICKSFRYDIDYILREKNTINEVKIIDAQASAPKVLVEDSLTTHIRKKVRVRTRLRSFKHALRPKTRYKDIFRKRDERLRKNTYENPQGAILTLTGYRNYGNILQRYALQKFLMNHGHRLISYAQEPFNVEGKAFDRFRDTIKFVEQRIPRKSPDPKDDYSLYVTGSDQVWRKWGKVGPEKELLDEVRYYFFNSVNDDAKKVAYAASFGHDDIKLAGLTPEFMKSVKPLVKKMTAISMREKSGLEIVKKWWGTNAQLVVDPTLLLQKKEYDRLIDFSTCKLKPSKQMFAYILAQDERRPGDIDMIGRIHKFDYEATYLNGGDRLISIEQWLKNIRDAELVVTDSFHGVVFSIITNTPFIVLVNEVGGISRIETLLGELGLENRLLRDGDIDNYKKTTMKTIDWSLVNRKVKTMRRRSSKWLLQAVR